MMSDAEMGAENKSGLKGFAAILSDAAVAALQAQTALVDYIEPDQKGGRPAPRARGPAGGGLPPPVGV